MIAKDIDLSNIISAVSDNILRTAIPLDIKKIVVFIHTLSGYNNLLATKFTRLISGNNCVQDERMESHQCIVSHAWPMYG